MPISPALITHAEIIVNGIVAAAGSTSRSSASVWHYRRVSTIINPVKLQLANIFNTNIISKLLLMFSVRYTGINISVRWLNDAQDAQSFTPSVSPGTIVGDSMPTTNAAFLLFGTGLRGRSYRGSKHLFPIAESATTVLTDDIFNAAALTYIGNLATAALAQLTDSGGNVWQPCVLSRKLSQLKTNPTTVVSNDVTSISVCKRVGIMRHRRVKSVY